MTISRDQAIATSLGIIALATVVVGLSLGGNPATARREKRDQQRVEALSWSQNTAEVHYRNTGSVPTSTAAFWTAKTTLFGGSSPQIAEEFYPEYTFVSSTRYTLCTTFEDVSPNGYGYSLARPTTINGEEPPNFWNHGAGKTCYTINIPRFVQNEVAQMKEQTSSTRP